MADFLLMFLSSFCMNSSLFYGIQKAMMIFRFLYILKIELF